MPEISEPHTNGHKALDPVAELSLQRRAEDTPTTGGVFSWWFARTDDGSELPPYWSHARDIALRQFIWREGNDILQGALSSMVKWGKTLSWVVEGPDRVVNRYQGMLSESEFGEGWGTLVSKVLTDYLTQDKGASIEVIGAGNPDGPVEGPVLGLAHLDAQYIVPTGDISYPVIFNNPKDGKPHKIHATRVIRLVDMPSPNENLNGIGFCAVSRVIATTQVLLKLIRYKNEKLSDMPEAGLLVLNNIMPKAWEDVQARHQKDRRKLGQEIWSNIMTLFSIDPAQPATANFVSFATLPDGFNEAEATDTYLNIVALAFGVDKREFWPESKVGLGGNREAEVMNEKAKGKGKGDFIASIERAINWKVLPSSVNFRFDFRDDAEDKLKADINKVKTETVMSMWDSEAYRAGLVPPVSALELRQMLADNIPDYFKQDFLEFDVSGESELTDTEREDKTYKQIVSMAEKNYQDGRISLDDLIEFRLSRVIDERIELPSQP